MRLLLNLARLHPHTAKFRKRIARPLRPVRPSQRDELNYREKLNHIVDGLRPHGKQIAAEIKSSWPTPAEATDSIRTTDGGKKMPPEPVPQKFGHIVDKARANGAVNDIDAHRLASVTVAMNVGTVDGRLAASVHKSIGIDISKVLSDTSGLADEMAKARRANVELIQSIPEQYFDKIDDAIGDAWENGEHFETLADRIEEIGDVTESRAALIARDQTSKMNSAFNQVRQTSLGVTSYVWQTAEDERVRDSHADLDGQTFEWDDPPSVDGEPANPGEPINCRCVASPVLDLDDEDAAGGAALEGDEDDDLLEAA